MNSLVLWADCLQLAACHRAISQVECTTCSSAEPSRHLDALLTPPLSGIFSPSCMSNEFSSKASAETGGSATGPECHVASQKIPQLRFLRSRLMADPAAVRIRPPCRQHCHTICPSPGAVVGSQCASSIVRPTLPLKPTAGRCGPSQERFWSKQDNWPVSHPPATPNRGWHLQCKWGVGCAWPAVSFPFPGRRFSRLRFFFLPSSAIRARGLSA